MDFDFNEEQQLLADSVRKYLGNTYSFEARKAIIGSASGSSADAWRTFADMGLTAIPFSEEDGGLGGGAVDLMASMEAFGESLVVEPVLDNIALAGRAVAGAGSAAQRATVLPGLMDGSTKLALAYLEPGRRYALDAASTVAAPHSAEPGAWVLNGKKVMVVGAPLADTLVVSARTANGTSLFLVDGKAAGVTVTAYRTVDGQRAGDVQFANVRLGAEALLGSEGQALPAIEEALDFATALLCCDAVGAMKSANDATLDYLKTRKQFGTAIGSFQALQHRMVDMFIACEQARSMATLAVSQVDAAAHSRDAATVAERKAVVSSAFICVADAARQVSQESVQLHGGMGMTEELKVSHTFRRLTVLSQRFGDVDHHLARYAALT